MLHSTMEEERISKNVSGQMQLYRCTQYVIVDVDYLNVNKLHKLLPLIQIFFAEQLVTHTKKEKTQIQ